MEYKEVLEGMTGMFIVFVVVTVSWIYTYVKTFQFVDFAYVQFLYVSYT